MRLRNCLIVLFAALSIHAVDNLEVHSFDEVLHENNISKPRIYVKNTSSRPLSNFKVYYYFSTEDEKTPVLEDYYTPDCDVYLDSLGEGDFKIIYDYTGFILHSGAITPNTGGNSVGLHYPDWSVLDKSNDYSNNYCTSFLLNEKIVVVDSNNLVIYGKVPRPNEIEIVLIPDSPEYDYGALNYSYKTSEEADTIKIAIPSFVLIPNDSGEDYRIKLKRTLPSETTGHPELVHRIFSCELEENQIINVEVLGKDSTVFTSYEIAPVLLWFQGDSVIDYYSSSYDTLIDSIYASDRFYSEKTVDIQYTKYKDNKYAKIKVEPFRYNPVTQELVVYYNMDLKINKITDSAMGGLISLADEEDTGYSIYDLLIVTVDRLISEVNRLAEWKRQLGFRTKVVSQELWADTAHSDIMNEIPWEENKPYSTINNNIVRQEIASYYNNGNGIKYLLLIGTPDDILPFSIQHQYRPGPPHLMPYSAYRSSDLYYANYSSIENHALVNISKECESGTYESCDCVLLKPVIGDLGVTYTEDYYCSYEEYLDDIRTTLNTDNYYPDVGYGRISVNTESELRAVIDKIINFEKEASSNNNYYDKFLIAAEASTRYLSTAKEIYKWNTAKGKNGEYLFSGNEYTDDEGFNIGHIEAESISTIIENGAFFVMHRDHGTVNGWVNPSYVRSDIVSLSNTDLPFVFSIDCGTGSLYPSGFGHEFIKLDGRGAIVAVGGSGQSLYPSNNVLAKAITYSILPGNFSDLDLNLDIIDAENQSYRIGDILNQAKFILDLNFWDRTQVIRKFERYSVAGDPTVPILTEMPGEITADYQKTLDLGTNSINLSNISCSKGMVTLLVDGELIAREEFDTSNIILNIDSINTYKKVILTISEYGYKPLIDTLKIGDPQQVTNNIQNEINNVIAKIDDYKDYSVFGFKRNVVVSEVLDERGNPGNIGLGVDTSMDVYTNELIYMGGGSLDSINAVGNLSIHGQVNNIVQYNFDTIYTFVPDTLSVDIQNTSYDNLPQIFKKEYIGIDRSILPDTNFFGVYGEDVQVQGSDQFNSEEVIIDPGIYNEINIKYNVDAYFQSGTYFISDFKIATYYREFAQPRINLNIVGDQPVIFYIADTLDFNGEGKIHFNVINGDASDILIYCTGKYVGIIYTGGVNAYKGSIIAPDANIFLANLGSFEGQIIGDTISIHPGIDTIRLSRFNTSYIQPEFSFSITPSPVPMNTPATINYTIPSAYDGTTVRVLAQREWDIEILEFSGSAGNHQYTRWEWNKYHFGGSGPWTIELEVNGIVKESTIIEFDY